MHDVNIAFLSYKTNRLYVTVVKFFWATDHMSLVTDSAAPCMPSFVLTTFWWHLWFITEQAHSNMELNRASLRDANHWGLKSGDVWVWLISLPLPSPPDPLPTKVLQLTATNSTLLPVPFDLTVEVRVPLLVMILYWNLKMYSETSILYYTANVF